MRRLTDQEGQRLEQIARAVGAVRGGLRRVLAVRRGPRLLPRESRGGGQVQVQD
ncbi:hypothetical protein ACFXKC_54105 [Streptomyces sp. NPDC059340]|uniref:hypothetical protein n=1 Tax=Streptomyces sp. NPDC059340 TaxID=3346806 RepID=UPI0036D1DCC4